MHKVKKLLFLGIFFLLSPLTVSAALTETVEMGNLINEGEVIEEKEFHRYLSSGFNRSYEETLKQDIMEHKSIINVAGYGFNDENIQDEITAFINRNPELFFLGDNFRVAKNSSGEITKLSFNYIYDKATTDSMIQQIENEANAFLSSRDWSSLSASDKVLLVHDYVACHCVYDEFQDNSYNLYGALVERAAVCQGYAQMEEYLLGKLGVTSGVATSMQLNHAWNVVKVGNNWYHSDSTYDNKNDAPGRVQHDYVLISSNKLYSEDGDQKRNDFTATIADTSVSFSKPTSTTYDNMFWENSDANIVYLNGKWYYVPANKTKIIEQSGSTEKTIWETEDWAWDYSYLHKMCMCPGLVGSSIYFAGPHAIYKLTPPDSTPHAVFHTTMEIAGIHVEKQKLEYLETKNESEKTWNGQPDEHTFKLIEEKQATSTQDGYKLYQCSCGETKKEIIPHPIDLSQCQIILSESSVEFTGGESKPAVTIKYNGEILPDSCYTLSFSNASQIGTATVKATGKGSYTGSLTTTYQIVHTIHQYDEGKITVNPTCTNAGTKVYTCTICQATKTTRTMSLGHDWKESRTEEPTCINEGHTYYTCTRCSKEKSTTIAALGHDPIIQNQKDPTAEEDGYTGDTVCQRCHEILSEGTVIQSTGHHYDAGTQIQEASCEKQGIIEYHCTDEGCNESYRSYTPALGHKGVLKGSKKATCTSEGYSGDLICSVCNKTIQKGKSIAKTEHQYNETNRVVATCKEEGYILYQCKNCQEKKKEVLPISNHNFQSKSSSKTTKKTGYQIITKTTWNECSHCHEKKNQKNSVSYKINNSKIKSAKYKKGKTTVKWSKVKGINGYQLRYAKKKNMKSTKSTKLKGTSKNIKGKYFFQIRTYKKINGKIYYSGWSAIKKSK